MAMMAPRSGELRRPSHPHTAVGVLALLLLPVTGSCLAFEGERGVYTNGGTTPPFPPPPSTPPRPTARTCLPSIQAHTCGQRNCVNATPRRSFGNCDIIRQANIEDGMPCHSPG